MKSARISGDQQRFLSKIICISLNFFSHRILGSGTHVIPLYVTISEVPSPLIERPDNNMNITETRGADFISTILSKMEKVKNGIINTYSRYKLISKSSYNALY